MDDFWSGKGEQAGVICKDFRLIDFCFLQGPFWLICHLWFSKERSYFHFLPFRLMPLGSLGWCLAQTTAGYCQFCVGLWDTVLQCLFQMLFENTSVWLPPLTAWTSVFTHYGKKKKWKGKDKRLLETRRTLFKRQVVLFRGNSTNRLMQSTPFRLMVWGLTRTSEMSIFFWSLSPSPTPICVSLALLL